MLAGCYKPGKNERPSPTSGKACVAATFAASCCAAATAKVGANFAPAQKVFNYNFTSTHRGNLYVYGELGGAIPRTLLSIHSHLAHTGAGFDLRKPYFDYNFGITARYKSLALDASVVGTNMHQSDFARSGLCRGAGSAGAISICSNAFYRTTKPVGVVSLTASL